MSMEAGGVQDAEGGIHLVRLHISTLPWGQVPGLARKALLGLGLRDMPKN